MIHRLDLAQRELQPGQRGRQRRPADAVDACSGSSLFVAVLSLRARPPHARPLRLHRGLDRALCCSRFPACCRRRFSEVNGAKIWIRFGGFSIQPGEFAKILLIIFFAAVPGRRSASCSPRRASTCLGMELPRARDLAPLLVAWVALDRRAGARRGPRHLAAVLRHRAGDALRGHRTGVLGGHRARRCSSAARWWPTSSSATSGCACRSGWTRSPTSTAPATRSVQSLFGLGTGGVFGTGLGAGRPELVPTPRPTSCCPRSARSSA